MANPFPANFEGLDGSRRLTGQVNFTDPTNQPTNATSVGGVTVSGTPSAGEVLTATSSTAADWEAGGGSSLAVGAYVTLANDTVVAAGATIPFDTVAFDPGGYFDAAGHRFVIPAGKAGLHLVGMQLQVVASVLETNVRAQIGNGGSGANLDSAMAESTSPHIFLGNPSLLLSCAVSDSLTPSYSPAVDASATIAGGANGSVFWIAYLGPLV